MLKTGFLILIIFNFSLCPAQVDSIARSPFKTFDLKLAYISSVIYPGVSAGVEFPIKQNLNYPSKKKHSDKYFAKSRFITANINWYHHPDFHDNLYLTSEWVMRRTKPTGFISEFSLGPGFSRTFNGGTTYEVSDNGSISVVKLAGYNYALITVGGGLGYDYSVRKNFPCLIFAKMNLISMFPYNSTIYFRPVMELGIRYMPSRRKGDVLRQHDSKSNQK